MTATRDASSASGPRASILNAAVRLFGQRGYNGTSMRDIATAVGLLPGSLYAHITSKEELLREIVTEGINEFIAEVETAIEDVGPAVDRLRAAIRAHLAVVAANQERSLVVFHQWRYLSDADQVPARAKRRRYEATFANILHAGISEGALRPDLDERVAVLSMLGALNWAAEWYSPAGRLTPDELGTRMADTLIAGILPA